MITLVVDWCLTALSAQTGYIVPQEYEIYYIGPGEKTNTIKQYSKPKMSQILFGLGLGDDPLATIRLPQRCLSSQSLGKY